MTLGKKLGGAVLVALLLCAARAADGSNAQQRFDAANQALQAGNFEDAVTQFSRCAQDAARAGDSSLQARSLMRLATAKQFQGDYAGAQAALDAALKIANSSNDPTEAEIQAARGANFALTRQWDQAAKALSDGEDRAVAGKDARGLALVLANLANVQISWGDPWGAADTGLRAQLAAARIDNPILDAQIKSNTALAGAMAHSPQAAQLTEQAHASVDQLDASFEKSLLLLRIGRSELLLAAGDLDHSGAHVAGAFRAIDDARQIGRTLPAPRVEGYALGMLGALYESQSRHDDALKLTRQAVFIAQQQRIPEAQYRWQWQAARIMRARGDGLDPTIEAYQRAVATLQTVRADVAIGFGNALLPMEQGRSAFRQATGDLFTELADLLLKRAAAHSGEQASVDLRAARDTVESLKTAELEDYFQSDCATLTRANLSDVEKLIDSHTAIVYVIPLDDRTEMLLSLSGGRIERATSSIGRKQLLQMATRFRVDLEDRLSHAYMLSGKDLYDALIGPLESSLKSNGIDTMVFIPDDKLRTVPMSALWDGQDFLIKRFAIAVSPGLTLMRTGVSGSPLTALAGGLTQAEEGYPALRSVAREIGEVRAVYPCRQLVDDQFTQEKFQQDLDRSRYGIVHIATHGEFKSDSAQTFILTHGGRMDLDALSQLITPNQYRGAPVQLLTLSACETAAGDDRAALGLGGVALKAGARTVMATLWSVNDRVSAELVGDFYRTLHQSGDRAKAGALRSAQLRFLGDEKYRRFRHPCYWSPYLVIGDWQ